MRIIKKAALIAVIMAPAALGVMKARAQGDVNAFFPKTQLPTETTNIRNLYNRAKLACLDGAGATNFWITVDPASGAMNYTCSFNPNRY